jgi:UDP-N-acetylmuramoyl-L-alanyl-D-glutamate--2,6-diaminopimelate ligase
MGKRLAEFVSATVDCADIVVNGLTLDSRSVCRGNLFIALSGQSVDGRQYISQAQQAGAVAVLIEDFVFQQNPAITIPVIKVADLAGQLAGIARRFYNNPFRSLSVYGVTGTNGKTSCSQLIMQLLSAVGHRCAVLGTTGWGIGEIAVHTTHTTPDAISLQSIGAQLVSQGATALAMEVSSHALDQGRIDGIAVHTGIYTNLSRDHLDYHQTMQAYGDAKRRLFELPQLSNAVINIDDAFGRDIASTLDSQIQLLSYSLKDESASVLARSLVYSIQGVSGLLSYDGDTVEFHSPLIGQFNVSNLLAAVATLLADGYLLGDIVPHLANLQPARGRLEVVDSAEDITVMVDYAHTPDALEQVLKSVKKHCQQSLWVVFGCGGDRDKGKRPLMASAAERYADKLVITSDNPRTEQPDVIINDITHGLSAVEAVVIEPDRERAIAHAVSQAEAGDCIVVAGKGHEIYQDIMGVKYDFDDVEKVKTALSLRGGQ